MQGERGSFFKAIFTNPLVWVGLVLTYFTLYYEKEDGARAIFFQIETYRNLAIGALIYTLLFNRQYTKGRQKVDIFETLIAAVEAMGVIFAAWAISTAVIVNYQMGGKRYSRELRGRYKLQAEGQSAAQGGVTLPAAVTEAVTNSEILLKKKYKVVPQGDGSFVVEVIE